jgi:hypothetical protein
MELIPPHLYPLFASLPPSAWVCIFGQLKSKVFYHRVNALIANGLPPGAAFDPYLLVRYIQPLITARGNAFREKLAQALGLVTARALLRMGYVQQDKSARIPPESMVFFCLHSGKLFGMPRRLRPSEVGIAAEKLGLPAREDCPEKLEQDILRELEMI